MAGRKAGGHLEQTGQLSSLGSVMCGIGQTKKTPDQPGEDRGREVGLYLHQRANNIALLLD
jgi:hypothetical protein